MKWGTTNVNVYIGKHACVGTGKVENAKIECCVRLHTEKATGDN